MHKMTGWALLGLDVMWIIGWIILLGFGHASTEPNALEYRHQITYLVFHPLINFVLLLYILRNIEKQRNYGLAFIFVFIVGLAVNVNSMVETIIHLPQTNHMWSGMMALSISAVIITGLTILWYLWHLRKIWKLEIDMKKGKLGWGLVVLEIIWIVGWIVLLGFGHASADPNALEYRHQITYLVFHPLTNFVLLLHILRNINKPQETNMVMIFVFLFGLTIDTSTMVETIIHLPQSNGMWAGMMALSISAVAIAAMTFLWYFWQMRKKHRHFRDNFYKELSDDRSDRGFTFYKEGKPTDNIEDE
jgi:uncharacterized membrane protein